MGGITSSDFNREELAKVSWLVQHGGVDSPWAQFCMRRYGTGFAATGVGMNVALPHLLRRRLQDWAIQGCTAHLGSDFVSFGRELGSLSRSDARLFHGVDIRFGDHGRTSWIWYCSTHEWLLQLHKAVLEPLPALPEWVQAQGTTSSISTVSQVGTRRWPGRPRYLGDPPPGRPTEAMTEEEPAKVVTPAALEQLSPGSSALPEVASTSQDAASTSPATEVSRQADPTPDMVEHQLSLFLSNSDGHVGLLVLPVPVNRVSEATAAVAHWSEHCEVPLTWAGRRYRTEEDFAQLQQAALNMPDLFLLGLEAEVAMAMTPDWTWEKYPRGFGEAAVFNVEREDEDADEEAEIAEAVAAIEAAEAAAAVAEAAADVDDNAVVGHEAALPVSADAPPKAGDGVIA